MPVTLREMSREEYHEFFRQYVSDPMMDPRPYRYQYTHVDLSYTFDQSRRDWYPSYGVFLDESPIGILSLKRIDKVAHRCEIGIILMNDACKGQGYGTKAMQLGIELATRKHGVTCIMADTAGRNKRMQHILTKLGFRLTEVIPQAFDFGLSRDDRLVYLWEVEA